MNNKEPKRLKWLELLIALLIVILLFAQFFIF